MVKGRFAPSPSGRMHAGNVLAALLSWVSARRQGGMWLLRMEDLDRERCRPEYAALIMEDLHWLGLDWDEGPRSVDDAAYFQSRREEAYAAAYAALEAQGIVYGCYCTRADVRAASAPQSRRPAGGTDGGFLAMGAPYPGTCRALPATERERLAAVRAPARRVLVGDAAASFTDGHYGPFSAALSGVSGDFVVRRADGTFSYQLAVTVDDAQMGVTEVVRGADLLPSTFCQLFLYGRLGLASPRFCHIPLLVAPDGRRLSKRDRDADMGALRARLSAEQVIGRLLWLCGSIPEPAPLSAAQAVDAFSWGRLPRESIVCPQDFGME